MKITIDPEFKALIPPLSAEEYNQLEANLKADGCREALVTWEGLILDGHNRFELCTKNGIAFEKIIKRFTDRSEAIEWIIRNQFGRRNLPPYERTKLVLRLEETIAARAKANQRDHGGTAPGTLKQNSAEVKPVETREELAKLAGVSHDTISKVKKIEEKGTPELKAKLAKGEISINKASKEVAEPKHPKVKITHSEGMGIFAASKSVMQRIHTEDTERENALNAMIQYCQNRITNQQ